MTGLDRLRDLASCLRTGASVSLWWLSTVAYSEEHGLDFRNTGPEVPDVLREIADQIEAEQEERATRRVEDREAAAWVRGQGGLERVKGLLDWVVGYCSTKQQLDFDFWLSGRVMHELGFEGDMADRDEVERRLLARLMPEGMEWLIEAWPKFEDDAPVKLGDMALVDGDAGMVEAVQIWIHGKPVIYGDNGSRQLEKGERVKRPATKVLDADGAEIRAGEMVYHIETGDEFTVIAVDAENGDVHVRWGYDFEDKTGTIDGSYLTHQRPVLDADGVPIREGDTVYEVGENYPPFVVGRLPEPGAYRSVRVVYPSGAFTFLDPERLTHTKPDPTDSRQAIVNEIGDEMAARIDLLVNSGRWSDAD